MPSQLLGAAVLETYDFRHSRLWVWVAFAVVGAWIVGLNLVLVLCATLIPGKLPCRTACSGSCTSTLTVARAVPELSCSTARSTCTRMHMQGHLHVAEAVRAVGTVPLACIMCLIVASCLAHGY